jgi:IS30 family transposase
MRAGRQSDPRCDSCRRCEPDPSASNRSQTCAHTFCGSAWQGPGNQSTIGTLVKHSTRSTTLLHRPGRHDAATVADAMIRETRHLPEHLHRSITWDRGTEMADYARIQLALHAKLYFCDPRSP